MQQRDTHSRSHPLSKYIQTLCKLLGTVVAYLSGWIWTWALWHCVSLRPFGRDLGFFCLLVTLLCLFFTSLTTCQNRHEIKPPHRRYTADENITIMWCSCAFPFTGPPGPRPPTLKPNQSAVRPEHVEDLGRLHLTECTSWLKSPSNVMVELCRAFPDHRVEVVCAAIFTVAD